jgi:predicted tellurium resistance membrane protein TerC
MDFLNSGFSLLVLIILEIVLGIDNLIMLSILTEKLPENKRKKARRWGLSFSWITRLLLLASAVFLVKLTHPLIEFNGLSFSARDIFLLIGGMFLIWKATDEIHHDINQNKQETALEKKSKSKASFKMVIIQVGLMDVIFSLDSVLTAVGLTTDFWIMAIAITCAILIMLYASEPVGAFIEAHPTVKILALGYLILIGMVLFADGLSFHIPRGYLYFALGFSLVVEFLNILKRGRKKSQE